MCIYIMCVYNYILGMAHNKVKVLIVRNILKIILVVTLSRWLHTHTEFRKMSCVHPLRDAIDYAVPGRPIACCVPVVNVSPEAGIGVFC